jgi:hypothetical protein
MTPRGKRAARRATVALTRAQVEAIFLDMGWEHEDVATFWRLARREMRETGCLDAERRKYCQQFILPIDTAGQQ